MRFLPLRRLLRVREDTNRPDLEVLSVYREHGVVPKSSRADNYNKTPDDLSRYLRVRPGDLVVNKMKAWSGSVGVSSHEGIVSGDYLVCGVRGDMDPRYLHHVLRSSWFVGEMRIRSRGIRPSQERLYWRDLADIAIPVMPLEEQRRVADFLDDQVARLDAALEQAASIAKHVAARPVLALADRLLDRHGRWRRPAGWKLAPVSAYFTVDLGKMLNEERAGGSRLRPYLRNTNVQWDHIDTRDLKQMHFEPGERRGYGLVPGDLLICEGGQPGRAAIWKGPVEEIYYQKALHRARPRTGDVEPRWLLHLLRLCVAREMFTDESGTTIAHLTNEQLRALRLPFPPVDEQRAIVAEVDNLLDVTRAASQASLDLASLLQERRRALITACVTGAMDINSASCRARS
jgi:type I restriction enzyme S subunit